MEEELGLLSRRKKKVEDMENSGEVLVDGRLVAGSAEVDQLEAGRLAGAVLELHTHLNKWIERDLEISKVLEEK